MRGSAGGRGSERLDNNTSKRKGEWGLEEEQVVAERRFAIHRREVERSEPVGGKTLNGEEEGGN